MVRVLGSSKVLHYDYCPDCGARARPDWHTDFQPR